MSYPYFAINKTSNTYPIREYPINGQSSNTIIGRLYPNEICGCNTEHSSYVLFLSSSGTLKNGLLDVSVTNLSNIENYPYSREVIDGKTYLIYHMRKTKNVYKGSGERWGSVAAGMYVATDNCEAGESHKDWMKIKYVKSTSGQWVAVTGDGYNHGFVDTGLSTASAGSIIALHGNW